MHIAAYWALCPVPFTFITIHLAPVITKSRDQSSGIIHIEEDLQGYSKNTDHFWEIHFEALEADVGQNAPETSGEVGLSWE